MFKKIKERVFHFSILTFFAGLFLGINLSFNLSATEPAHKYLDYFHHVFQYIQTDYVDTINTKDIFYGAIKGMIHALNDPFSRFLNENDFAELKEDTTGEFVGVGIEISVKDGEVIVVSPIEDTPAMRAGIKAGDIIYKVNDTIVKNKSLADIIKLIRGMTNTKVKLLVKREGFDGFLDFDMERAPIKTKSVKYDVISGTEIGYIKIKMFSADTPRETEDAIKSLSSKGIKKIILDLRWNPGGLLDGAIKIAELFLDKDKTIVTTKGREGSGNVKESKSMLEPVYKDKLILLVNRGSASASEILAGAIRDNHRGKLVGEKTFGKGSIQKLFQLSDKIGVTLTVAKYYTPSGLSIHGIGIKPDIPVEADIIPVTDRKNVNQIIRDKITEKYVKSHKVYDTASKTHFLEYLKGKNLSLSDKTAFFLLKNEINKYSKPAPYDLEFDTQLQKAIQIINAK